MNYQRILNEIGDEVKPLIGRGKVADYIPALAKVPSHKFGIALKLLSGKTYTYGDAYENFSIQSISKVFSLSMALKISEKNIWKRVGREPSGNPFNSLVQLEHEGGIPRNPFINAGALVITDYLCSHYNDPISKLLHFIQKLAGNPSITFDANIAKSEKEHGHLNAALAHFLKSYGNLDNDVESVLDIYFHQCSISMSCVDLSNAIFFLANGGKLGGDAASVILDPRQTKKVNSLMLTCGTYDVVGDFAYRVGMPGKSGVGGGIAAVVPGHLSICAWSPELNHAGNSLLGTKALELFTTKTQLSIF